MSERPTATCARCHTSGPRRGVTWPEGYVCRRCYQRATGRHGSCPSCQQQRLLPGLDNTGAPICADCAGIPQDFHCTRCGQEDEPHRRGLCARCSLRDDLDRLLDDGAGHVRSALRPVLDAICAQEHPRSALRWLRNPDVQRLLRGLATGQLSLTHATFDAESKRRTAAHLRGLLMRHGALPARDPALTAFELWLHDTLPGHSPAIRRLLQGFATWHHLRRIRSLAAAGKPTGGSTDTARQEITVAGQFLSHLESQQIPFSDVRQAHLDAWLAAGPCTRHTARTFVVWAVKGRHLPALHFPYRAARSTPVMAQEERLRLLRTFLHDHEHPAWLRLAAVLLLLYGQPATRIGRLRVDDIAEQDGILAIRFGEDPAELPAPVADLLRVHLANRANTNTASNSGSEWLFPGYRPGQPLHRSYLMTRIRNAGVHLLGGRNSALRQLVLDMPPAVAAQALGYSPQVTEAHARNTGATWVTYAAYRSQRPELRQ